MVLTYQTEEFYTSFPPLLGDTNLMKIFTNSAQGQMPCLLTPRNPRMANTFSVPYKSHLLVEGTRRNLLRQILRPHLGFTMSAVIYNWCLSKVKQERIAIGIVVQMLCICQLYFFQNGWPFYGEKLMHQGCLMGKVLWRREGLKISAISVNYQLSLCLRPTPKQCSTPDYR